MFNPNPAAISVACGGGLVGGGGGGFGGGGGCICGGVCAADGYTCPYGVGGETAYMPSPPKGDIGFAGVSGVGGASPGAAGALTRDAAIVVGDSERS